MLHALAFAVHDCGFRARCTLGVDESGAVRIENIYGIKREEFDELPS